MKNKWFIKRTSTIIETDFYASTHIFKALFSIDVCVRQILFSSFQIFIISSWSRSSIHSSLLSQPILPHSLLRQRYLLQWHSTYAQTGGEGSTDQHSSGFRFYRHDSFTKLKIRDHAFSVAVIQIFVHHVWTRTSIQFITFTIVASWHNSGRDGRRQRGYCVVTLMILYLRFTSLFLGRISMIFIPSSSLLNASSHRLSNPHDFAFSWVSRSF